MSDPVVVTVTVPDLPVVTEVEVLGVQGSPGIFIGGTAPVDTEILWADTATVGGAVNLINTDGEDGTTLFVGSVDPDGVYSLLPGDVWIEVPS